MAKKEPKIFRYQKREPSKVNPEILLYILFGSFVGLTWLSSLIALLTEPQPPLSILGSLWWIMLAVSGLLSFVIYPLVCLTTKETVTYSLYYDKDENAWRELEVRRG